MQTIYPSNPRTCAIPFAILVISTVSSAWTRPTRPPTQNAPKSSAAQRITFERDPHTSLNLFSPLGENGKYLSAVKNGEEVPVTFDGSGWLASDGVEVYFVQGGLVTQEFEAKYLEKIVKGAHIEKREPRKDADGKTIG